MEIIILEYVNKTPRYAAPDKDDLSLSMRHSWDDNKVTKWLKRAGYNLDRKYFFVYTSNGVEIYKLKNS